MASSTQEGTHKLETIEGGASQDTDIKKGEWARGAFVLDLSSKLKVER